MAACAGQAHWPLDPLRAGLARPSASACIAKLEPPTIPSRPWARAKSQYGALTEVWLDHGYTGSQQKRLQDLLATLQPHAVAFNGLGVSNNPSRWVGTEDGTPPYPVWSTGTSGQGDPTSNVWNPAVADTTLQTGDHW